MYRNICTSSSPEPNVKVIENSEVQVPRRPCGTRSPMGGNWGQNVENTKLRCVFFQIVFFLWQTGLFWIPVISGSNFANNYRIPRKWSCGFFSRCLTLRGKSNIQRRSASEIQSTPLKTSELNFALFVVQEVQYEFLGVVCWRRLLQKWLRSSCGCRIYLPCLCV